MKKILLIILTIITFCSCKKAIAHLEKNIQVSERNYHIEQYSGGKLIASYDFKGILNDAEGSDGYYFYENDTLFELSGQLVIKSIPLSNN